MMYPPYKLPKNEGRRYTAKKADEVFETLKFLCSWTEPDGLEVYKPFDMGDPFELCMVLGVQDIVELDWCIKRLCNKGKLCKYLDKDCKWVLEIIPF